VEGGHGVSPRVCVVTGCGINADEELALGFTMAGAEASRVHVTDLVDRPSLLAGFRILAFPGGFSFGDHLGSGRVFAALVKKRLGAALRAYVSDGGLVIGICNGFQVLAKLGILPDLSGTWTQEVSLAHNDSGKFEDRWVRAAAEPRSPCLWTRGLTAVDMPVRHGEGKLVAGSPEILAGIRRGRLAALRYASRSGGAPAYPENPNGSIDDIAGLCDRSGRVFGLMPHPEAFLFPENHPEWTRRRVREGGGLAVLAAGVAASTS
jgi:phosphoribosylformylglycinamidine synthase subunit PurQ / glutaminase